MRRYAIMLMLGCLTGLWYAIFPPQATTITPLATVKPANSLTRSPTFQRQPSTPPEALPAMPTPTPTPHLDELAAIAQGLKETTLPEHTPWVKFNEARLVLEDAPDHDAKDKLVRVLVEQQPLIDRAIALSRQTLEPLPPLPIPSPANLDAYQRHPRSGFMMLSRALFADASRCFEDRQPSQAVERIATMMRLARQLLNTDDHLIRMHGATFITQASKKIAAMVREEPELMARVPAPLANDLRAIYESFDRNDPDRRLSSWEPIARRVVEACRADFGGPDGPMKWAQSLREFGANTPGPPLPGLPANWNDFIPQKQAASFVENCSAADLNRALDEAQAAIPAIAKALTSEDQPALDRALTILNTDRTHLARSAVGSALMALPSVHTTRAAIAEGYQATQSLPK